jgi:anti-sigma factor RsiW
MMNDCADGNMRDRLPEYVHGALSVSEREAVARHLESCEDCRAEVELIEAAARAMPMPTIDIAKIVSGLPRSRKPEAGRRFAGAAWRVAAGIGIVVLGTYAVVRSENPGEPKQQVAVSAPTASATAPQVTPAPSAQAVPTKPDSTSSIPAQVAMAPATARAKPAMSFGGGLSDLSDEQLDALLGELDGLDSLPSVEPETHLTPILPPADGGHGAR